MRVRLLWPWLLSTPLAGLVACEGRDARGPISDPPHAISVDSFDDSAKQPRDHAEADEEAAEPPAQTGDVPVVVNDVHPSAARGADAGRPADDAGSMADADSESGADQDAAPPVRVEEGDAGVTGI